ncbi:MAG: hypothetical protein ACFE9S_07360 [Candidatus Hermodarchaeota archaeon]
MPEEIIEDKDGMRIRKLAELRTSTAKDYEDAMLRRVEEFKDVKGDKSGFNNMLQNTFFKALSTALDLKVQVDKALGEDNLKKLRKAIDDILLLGL